MQSNPVPTLAIAVIALASFGVATVLRLRWWRRVGRPQFERSPSHTTRPAVLILTAISPEYDAVRARFVNWRLRRHPAGTLFEQADWPGTAWSVVIGRSGAGSAKAAIVTERAITMFQPRLVLFVGVAGALHDDLRLGDVIVATKVYAYHGGKYDDEGFHARPDAWAAPHDLEELARHVAVTGAWIPYLPPTVTFRQPTVHFRPIAAGEIVLNSRTAPLTTQLHRLYNDAAAIEMESAGVASAGHLNQTRPVLTIRGISDKADGTKHYTTDATWQSRAAANATAFTLALASSFLESQRSCDYQGRAIDWRS